MMYCPQFQSLTTFRKLGPTERIHYRDKLREARYAALADAEGFGLICFALESLGLRLLEKEATLEKYRSHIGELAAESPILTDLPDKFPSKFKSFSALYQIVKKARNDAMHLGAYARHATTAAIELCIGLEESLMMNSARIVGDLMVTSPVIVESWQPVASARQLMLMHSFSFLPVRMNDSWWLISELCLAKYLEANFSTKRDCLGQTIEVAKSNGLEMIHIKDEELLQVNTAVSDVLQRSSVTNCTMLWLVVDAAKPSHLVGVLTPFELM